MSSDFLLDQKRYLEGFASGLAAARAQRGQLPTGATDADLTGPDAIHIKAQYRAIAAGGQLADTQHYISEIGLLACKVTASDDGDQVEGYHIYVSGGFGPDAALGREIYRDVKADDAPRAVERILKGCLTRRASPAETFLAFSRRHEIDALKRMFGAEVGA